MNDFKKKILKLYLDHPFDFNLYLDGYKNKNYAFRLIKSFIPTDTGIEWEIGDAMVCKLIRSYKYKPIIPRLVRESSFEVTYRINKSDLNRHLSQLKVMYEFMCRPGYAKLRQSKSGIHIHTNLFHDLNYEVREKLINDREGFSHKVVKMIARELFNYGGTYNQLKFDWAKGNAIIYRSNYKTIEYRCINMTWDFRELLKYIITCHQMTNLFTQYGSNKISGEKFLYNVKTFIDDIHEL